MTSVPPPALQLPRFEAWAAAAPDRPLVGEGGAWLTYGEINGRANRLAHGLQARGVGPQTVVGLRLPPGPDWLVAMLGVLKAGGAYLPLDPQWPLERLRSMAAVAKPLLCITGAPRPPSPGLHLDLDLDLVRDREALAAFPATAPHLSLRKDQWCYVLFTSGSTGTPKGVPVTHGNLAGLFPPLTAALGLGPEEVWTWCHSPSFGFSVWEIWGALLHGARLVILPEHGRQDPGALGALLRTEGVTVFSQTPSTYRRLRDDESFHKEIAHSSLRYLALSGEAVRDTDLASWFLRGHRARLISTYALTETGGQMTLRQYTPGDATPAGVRNLGRPLAGRVVRVLDEAGGPVSPGTPGELWVGGDCVTPGYLPVGSGARAFRVLSLGEEGLVRGYQTGDRVRELADGALEYLGRVDEQLKFRGHRIEPGELENLLREHPGVVDAAVALRVDRAGNQRLTGYLVTPEGSARAGDLEFWPSLGAYGIYDRWLYSLMNGEPVRLGAYRAALVRAVPGQVVLDIGTGADAVLARLCIELGAAHVYAVEVLEEAAEQARALVERLGLKDRITVLQGDMGDMGDLHVPEKVGVCTQGIVGNIGSADGIAPVWNGARQFFAPGCVPVPERCVTRVAGLELGPLDRARPAFGVLAADYARRVFAAVGQPFDLRLCLRGVVRENLLTAPAEFEVLDFRGPVSGEHAGRAVLPVTRDGLLDGCLLWTVVTAGPGQTVDYFSEQQAWLPVYLPLGDTPLPVRAGDALHLEWQSRLDSDPRFPDYTLTARVTGFQDSGLLTVTSRHRDTRAGGTRVHRHLLASLDCPDPASPVTVTALRRWLEDRVPDYLVPGSWVFLSALPLGPGGKLDRGALPSPGAVRPRLAAPPMPPRTPLEAALAVLWTEVLGLEDLGMADDFFDLGGDSITAVQLTTRVQRWLDAGVPLAALFEAPTLGGLALWLEQHFPEAVRAGLALTGRSAPAVPLPAALAVPSPPPVSDDPPTPLTFSQESLWFLHSLYPGDTSASEQFVLALSGPLNRPALARAWAGLFHQHPVLGARFRVEGEGVWQHLSPVPPPPLGWAEPGPAPADLVALAAQALATPFAPLHGRLVRGVLCGLAPERHALLVTAHHLVADGLSVGVLSADLARFYGAAVRGDLNLPLAGGLGPTYGELAAQPVWQRGADHPAALNWWRQRLAGLPPPALAGWVRPAAGPPVSRRVLFSLDDTRAEGVRRLAREQQATPYMVLLAAFRVLLARLTGEWDLCIGTPMTLRDTRELDATVGCLVNPVALRVRVDPAHSFLAQLAAERTNALETFPHRRVPFSRVVAALAPEREWGVHPLFQVLFSWEPASPGLRVATDGQGDLAIDLLCLPTPRSAYFALECGLRDGGEGAPMTGFVAWSTAVVEDWVAEQLPHRLNCLLQDALARPDTRVGELTLLDPAERQQMLLQWNATDAALPEALTLHDWVLRQAERNGDRVALRFATGFWTYGELARKSGALAGELAGRGVGAGSRVGVALGRSPELVLALLAVLRAGATVVPLDPGLPPPRLCHMAEDAALALVLVDQGGLTRVTREALGRLGMPLLTLVSGGTLTRTRAGVPPPLKGRLVPVPRAEAGADQEPAPAVLLYTSGSTGPPKGAFTTHRSALNRCHWMWTAFGFGPGEVFALRTTVNFIDAWWEIFGALGHGVELQIVPDEVASDPRRLPGFLAATGVTQLVLVPSLLRALLEQLASTPTPLPALVWGVVSGELLAPDLVRECRRLLPALRLLNTYGTSETWDATVCDTTGLTLNEPRVPLGRPIANARVYVLDEAGQPLPPGFPGELRVGGLGCGGGYWQRPQLNATQFVALNFPERQGERVYCTGDRARFLPDGQLEFLGRVDGQFKLRGQRIEPQEIEDALAAHPFVGAALVGPVGEGALTRLGAGLLLRPGAPPAGGELVAALRAHVSARLPASMVPTDWRLLPGVPLTPAGKLDRRAWLALGGSTPLICGEPPGPARPATPLETQLTALWCEVLGLTAIGLDDNFFALGGHSLLAARLQTRLRGRWGLEVALRTLFGAPTIRGLARALAEGDPALDAGFVAPSPPRSPAPSPPALPGGESPLLPVSLGQERLWFLEQLDPGSPAYTLAWTLRCTGVLEVGALQRGLDALQSRHPSLRTRFPQVGGVPHARVDPPGPVPLGRVDLTGEGAAPPGEAELDATLRRLAGASFSLEQGPLWRVTLVKTGPEDHRLLFLMSHIITDATSNNLLFADLASALSVAAEGGDLGAFGAAGDGALTYGAFARRQREASVSPAQQAALAVAVEGLQGAPPALEWATDRPRPAEQRFHGALVQRRLTGPLRTRLAGFAEHRSVTLFTVLLTAFKALLHRYSGAAEVLVGTPVEGRESLEVEQLVGLFINTLVLRTRCSGDPSFETLLRRVADTGLEAQSRPSVPFEQLVEALAPERSLSRSPVFQVMFNLLHLPQRTRRAGPLVLSLDRLIDLGVAPFDLTLTVAVEAAGQAPGGLTLSFEYATDLFDPATMEQLADSYLALLRGGLENPAQRLSRLPLLDGPGRQRVLALGQAPAGAGGFDGGPVHQQVAAHALRAPSALALRFGSVSLTYGELDDRANQLARHLVARGAGPGSRIGICLTLSPDLLVAMLGVLKSGGAYVPVDAGHPPARQAALADEGDLTGLVLDRHTRDLFPSRAFRVDMDGDRDEIAGRSPVPFNAPARPEDGAYLLFTSGSTGQPKGVLVSHGNVSRALQGWQSAYGLARGEMHLQMASPAFDVFTGNWVRALGTGGSLLLCPREVLLAPPALLALLAEERVAVAEFVPAILRLVLEETRRTGQRLPPLRLLLVGSDTWYGSDQHALRQAAHPSTRLLNSYGVTEATVDSTWFEDPRVDPPDGLVPVGRPLPGVGVYVLDEALEPLPRGVPGELCIGGGGVASGYWRAPALTAEKFVPDPFGAPSGGRLYRTGDRARWNGAGQLVLLGRQDDQFKLRGWRLEPGEIEACIAGLPGVAAAAVGLATRPGRDARLVAWVVAREAPLARDQWQQALRRQLPEQAVPETFVWQAALPLTPNGKVDREALRLLALALPWDQAREPGEQSGAEGAPRSPLEALVGELCADLLGLARLGLDENFFHRGGHSLLATRLVARLRAALGKEVPVRMIFEAPTPRTLAAALREGALPQGAWPAPVPQPRPPDGRLPLSAMQQRLWFLERLNPGTGAYHLHWLLTVRGPLDRGALQSACTQLLARHEVLRTGFAAHEGVCSQVLVPPFEFVLGEMEDPAPERLSQLISAPFELAAAPLLRITLLRTGPASHRLLLVMHHLVADGWSCSVLSRELAALYQGVRRGVPAPLPPLPCQYGDYALWQQHPAWQARLQPQLAFWQTELAGAPPLLLLPAVAREPGTRPDTLPAGALSGGGAWVQTVLPLPTLARLRRFALEEGATLFMVLLAGFKAVLARLAGVDQVLVGTPVAGRTHRELEDLIGFFVNTLVLRSHLGDGPTFRALVGRVRHTTLQAFEHGEVPFEKLVEVLQPRRSLTHSPLIQVLFALHNQPQQPLVLDGLEVATEMVESNTVKFDLNLHGASLWSGDGAEAGLCLALSYRTDLYSPATATALLTEYQALLTAVLADPDAPLLLPQQGGGGPVPRSVKPPGGRVIGVTPGPANATEIRLEILWSALLGHPAVGLDEDFFALGGHSLMAMRLVAAIARDFGVELPLISVFEAPTLRGLAARITAVPGFGKERPLTPIPRLPRRAAGPPVAGGAS